MKKIIVTLLLLIVAGAGIFLYSADGGFGKDLLAPTGPAFVKPVPEDWAQYQAAQRSAHDTHVREHQAAYNRFADFPISQTDGVPYIILKLLPVVAPEFWGEGDNFLSVMGLFFDERLPGAPLPRGMGFSGVSRKDIQGNIDYASFGCGACHIGRVRVDDQHFYYLDGGINSEFNVVGFRKRVNQTIEKVTNNETDPNKKNTLFAQKILAALDNAHAQDPNYFYKNFRYEDRLFDAAYEQMQIDLFKKNASQVIGHFVEYHVNEYAGWKRFVSKYYQGAQTQLLDGLPGMEDAIGFNTVRANDNLKKKWFTKPFASLALPPSHGVTDIMVIWEQNTHDPLWNSDKTDLINGGGQWNGHIPITMYKNIAAELTIGYEGTDVAVSAFTEELMDKMPAAVYPFDVDIELAKKGQALFAENCAACHQPHNGKVYRNIGTDMGRADISGLFVTLGAISGFTAVCNPDTVIDMYGKSVKPCAQYKGVSLEGKKSLAMTQPKLHDGYNALPLVGLWAQAPYLHNGSVPTLYHLLIPNERPDVFIKSRLDYDKKLIGFSWDKNEVTPNKEGYVFDTRLAPAMSNKGHDKDIVQDGKTFKLNWSDDKAGALAIIEYLKTL